MTRSSPGNGFFCFFSGTHRAELHAGTKRSTTANTRYIGGLCLMRPSLLSGIPSVTTGVTIAWWGSDNKKTRNLTKSQAFSVVYYRIQLIVMKSVRKETRPPLPRSVASGAGRNASPVVGAPMDAVSGSPLVPSLAQCRPGSRTPARLCSRGKRSRTPHGGVCTPSTTCVHFSC